MIFRSWKIVFPCNPSDDYIKKAYYYEKWLSDIKVFG